jgi:AraC family transcriptional regulator
MKTPLLPDALSRSRFHREGTVRFYEQAVKRVICAMRDHLSEPLNLESLAKIAIISPYHFHRVFSELTGITPGRFLAALRIERAKRLLATSTLGITDVCLDAGYNSLGTFTTIFTGFVGVSPNRFRCLAAEKSQPRFENLLTEQVNSQNGFRNSIIEGTVSASPSFIGTIFIGLFPTRVPQGFPIAGTKIILPGYYRITGVPDGVHYLLAAGVRGSQNTRSLLLPAEGLLHVASAGPISVLTSRSVGQTDLVLRPVDLTDPPVLVALPLLMAAETPTVFGSTTLSRGEASTALRTPGVTQTTYRTQDVLRRN